ncbi:MAG: ATP-binding protein [Desulfobacterales bacterium]|nr:ATP-binding protein [Desulfobacterales bacterium]
MTYGHEVSFRLTNQSSELDTLFQKVTAFCQSIKLSKKNTFQAGLVLEELFTNIVKYGYADQGKHRVDFTLDYKDETLIFKIEYDGMPFSPDDVAQPDIQCRLEDRKFGGLGIHFIRHCMNDFFCERRGDKNIITVIKTCPTRKTNGNC